MIGTVIRLLDGPLAPVACVSQTAYRRCDDCISEDGCRIRRLMGQVRDAMAGILDSATLADIGRPVETPGFQPNYDI